MPCAALTAGQPGRVPTTPAPAHHLSFCPCPSGLQCGQVHLLSAFDEDRRSCRDSLRRHQDCRLARKKRARQRAQQALRDAGAAAASAAAPKAAARPKAAPAGKAGAPKAAPGGKAGAPKGAPAKAAAAGETGAAGAPRAAATAKAPKTAKRKRQAKGAEAGPVRPRKQQKPSQQQGKEGSQEQQQKPPQPQGEEGSQLPKLQTKPRAGVQQVPAAKRARSEAAPSSDGSTQDRADIFKEEPSLPLPVPQTPAAPRSPQRACQPAAEPAPPALLPQQSCSQPLPPADEAPSTSASEQAEADEAAAAEPAPAAAAAPAAPPSRPPSHPVLSEPQQSQQQAAKRDAASDAAVWADWRQLMGQLEVQVPSDQPQQAQHGAARQALPPTQPPQPLLLCQALQLMDTPVVSADPCSKLACKAAGMSQPRANLAPCLQGRLAGRTKVDRGIPAPALPGWLMVQQGSGTASAPASRSARLRS